MTTNPALDRDALPVGRTSEAQARNEALLRDYDYAKYVVALTGYTGQDRQRIARITWQEAVRVRVGPRGNYKAGLAQLPDGRLLLAACRDNADPNPVARHFDIWLYESHDGGLSWVGFEHTPLQGKEPSLTALADGTLLLTAQYSYFAPGSLTGVMPLYRSTDGGRTWETTLLPGGDYPRNLTIEPDGSLLMIRALDNDWSASGKGSPHLSIGRSRDGGRTWSFTVGQVDWAYDAFGEIASLRLRDGRLLAALRRQIPGTEGEGFEDTVLTESHDDGATWLAPWRMTETAQVHVYLNELADGRLLATHSAYHLPWGILAMTSADGGRAWDHDRPYLLALSASYSVGWPVTLLLAEGDLLTAYAATTHMAEEPRHVSCEVVRWRLE